MWMDNWVLNTPLAHWFRAVPEGAPFLFRFFETQKTVVVLSSSNDARRESYEQRCAAHGVPILRRKGGGGTVVLGPGCLVLTFAFYAKEVFHNQEYFSAINGLWIDALQSLGIDGLSQNGISDICVGDKKIAGTSIFRKKHLLVYQGSLLVRPDMDLISTLLTHPSREPLYRQGRTHRDFLTSLYALGYDFGATELAKSCQEYFAAHCARTFATHCLL